MYFTVSQSDSMWAMSYHREKTEKNGAGVQLWLDSVI
jgi:hypothetical protein